MRAIKTTLMAIYNRRLLKWAAQAWFHMVTWLVCFLNLSETVKNDCVQENRETWGLAERRALRPNASTANMSSGIYKNSTIKMKTNLLSGHRSQ